MANDVRSVPGGVLAEIASNLPLLTLSEIKFVENVAGGLTISQAYIKAYDVDVRRSRNSISVAASRLKARPQVLHAIQCVRESGLEQAGYNVATHIGELQRLKREALENKNYGAAVRAEELTGKVAGFYTERKEITFKSSADNLLNDLAKVFGVEFAEQAAKKLGVSFNRGKLIDVTDS